MRPYLVVEALPLSSQRPSDIEVEPRACLADVSWQVLTYADALGTSRMDCSWLMSTGEEHQSRLTSTSSAA